MRECKDVAATHKGVNLYFMMNLSIAHVSFLDYKCRTHSTGDAVDAGGSSTFFRALGRFSPMEPTCRCCSKLLTGTSIDIPGGIVWS